MKEVSVPAIVNVLVVDDEPNIHRLFSEVLSRRGYRVVGALDGEAALQSLRADSPEVIFLDLKLPGADGTQVLEKIREIEPDIPVILITGYPRDPLVDKAIRMGVFACLVKPFGVTDILTVVEVLALDHVARAA